MIYPWETGDFPWLCLFTRRGPCRPAFLCLQVILDIFDIFGADFTSQNLEFDGDIMGLPGRFSERFSERFNEWDGITSGDIRSLSLFGGQKNDVPWCTMEVQWRYNIYRWMVIKKDSTIKHGVNLCKLMDLWGSKQWWEVGVPIV